MIIGGDVERYGLLPLLKGEFFSMRQQKPTDTLSSKAWSHSEVFYVAVVLRDTLHWTQEGERRSENVESAETRKRRLQ
jgi:hypothetical protein